MFQYTGMSVEVVTKLQQWQAQLLADIRPNAVGLVDSFDYHDEILSSALGAYDGQVYERLLESAMKSPLNAKPVHDSFRTSIEPLLKAKY
jgi:acyl-CoA oxidase